VAKYRVPKNNILSHNKQGMAEGSEDSAEKYKAHLLKTAPRIMDFLAKTVKGWRPSEQEMLGAIDTAYTVMKHTGDVKQAGKAMMDELNTLHRMSQGQRGVTEEQLDELKCWPGYHRVAGTKAGFPGSCAKNKTNEENIAEDSVPFDQCPHCRGPIVHESMLNEKQDACYHKVKSRYKVWPSAYASGALVQCRKKGASNWGNKSESVAEDQLDEKWSQKYKSSINCSNPKGFSQKAHCAGKKKNESAILSGLKLHESK
jgi:hypothetical protein